MSETTRSAKSPHGTCPHCGCKRPAASCATPQQVFDEQPQVRGDSGSGRCMQKKTRRGTNAGRSRTGRATPSNKERAVPYEKPMLKRVLAVEPNGSVTPENLKTYIEARNQEVSKRYWAVHDNGVVQQWWDNFSEMSLYEDDDRNKYLGNSRYELQTKEALQRAKGAHEALEIIVAVTDFIRFFCGFDPKVKCLTNALHFLYEINVQALLSATLLSPSADEAVSQDEKALFDEAQIVSAELLVRAVVDTGNGTFTADPFSPGEAMGYLRKLPLFAQFVMVLTNVVEAIWYQHDIPNCPMCINLYASLLVAGAPVLEMIDGVKVVEVMEKIKEAKRGCEVAEWVHKIRGKKIELLLDDFDNNHPGVDCVLDGIKISCHINAVHSFEVSSWEGGQSQVAKFYSNLVLNKDFPIKTLVMEGSENCMTSKLYYQETQGPAYDFSQPQATRASALVYQEAAKILTPFCPDLRICHQGFRALYDGEDFDEHALAVIGILGKCPQKVRMDAGSMACFGDDAERRARLKQRTLVCGVIKRPPVDVASVVP